jgi:cardiolipin synthase (CMP-forming)
MRLPAWLTIPNALTFARIGLTPFFGYFWLRHRFLWALAIFVIASVSDVLDGLLARLLNQRTRLGQLLDPIADKIMVIVAVIAAAAAGDLPRWLAGIILGRDAFLALTSALFAFVFRGIHGAEGWAPTRLGKYATFFTIGALGVALAWEITGYDPLRGFVGALGVLSALTTVVSGGQYIERGARAVLRGAKLARGGDPP